MNLIVPFNITDATFTSSTIPEPDSGESEVAWNSGTAYAIEDRAILTSTHKVYQAIVANTNKEPSADVATGAGGTGIGTYWQEAFPTNKWALFDNKNGTTSDGSSPLVIRVTPGVNIDSVAAFNITGATQINVVMNDGVERYNENITMIDDTEVSDTYQYAFSEVVEISEFIVDDLPYYPDSYIEITFTGSGDISVGTLIVGNSFNIGEVEVGTNIQLQDYSIKETDDFGNFTITPRRNSKIVDFKAYIAKDRVGFVYNKLRSLTTVPCVWYSQSANASEDDTILVQKDPTAVFGYYRDVKLNMENTVTVDMSMQIEGLI